MQQLLRGKSKSTITAQPLAPVSATTKTSRWTDRSYAVLFLGPSLLVLSVFVFWPMLKTIYLSFFLTDTYGRATVFTGISNYVGVLTDPAYLSSLGATLLYVLAVTGLTIGLGLVLAVTANQQLKGISFFKTLFSSTMGISVSVAAIFWLFAFNPLLGCLLKLLRHYTYRKLTG